jgi:hypothetical protein
VGFDTGEGLPAPKDYRDLPHCWSAGDFQPNRGRWEQFWDGAVILGDVGVTLQDYLRTERSSPMGFMAFDLDYYSSTHSALEAIRRRWWDDSFLPRTFCYFDDILGSDIEIHCEDVGELCAIKEFNDTSGSAKMRRINGLSARLRQNEWWHEMMYVLHIFGHPGYCRQIS